jgi:hypothetical protein
MDLHKKVYHCKLHNCKVDLNGASNGIPDGKSLQDYINKSGYEDNIVVKNIIIFNEV